MRFDIERLLRRVVNMLALGKSTVVLDDGAVQRMQLQVGADGPDGPVSIQDPVPRIGEYGFSSVPPAESDAIVIFLGGNRSNGVIIGTGHRPSRPRDLKSGEAMFYNGLTGAWIKLCEDGVIRSAGNWEHDGSITATGDIIDNAPGNAATLKALRDAHNGHHHPDPHGGNTGTPDQTV